MTDRKNDRLQPEGNPLGDLLPKLAVPVAILILWIVVSEFRLVRPIFVPPPTEVWKALLGMYTLLPRAILTTVAMTLTGFGIGRAPQIALIALGTSVVLGITTLEAIRNVPPIYIRAALTLGADRKRIYTTVIVPYIVPHLIGAIRVAAASSWGLDVAAEFMGSQAGLG